MDKNCEDISYFVAAEIEKFKKILDVSLFENKPFDYLKFVSSAYNIPEMLVFDESLDIFNHYISRGADSKKAIRWSLEKAHEDILKKYLF